MTLPEIERLMARTRERAEAAYREKRPVEACSLLADLAKLELEYGVRLNDPNAFSLVHAERSFQEAVTIARMLEPAHKDAARTRGFPSDQTPTERLIDRLEASGESVAAEAVRLAEYGHAIAILLDNLLAASSKTDPAPPE
jgi:hypothetical protein